MRGKSIRSKRREIRQYYRHILLSGVSAFLMALVGVGVWYGTRHEAVTITSISVEGGETVSHALVREKAESALDGTYALLIPKTFSFLVPSDNIARIVNAIPKVHNASVVKANRNEIKVIFEEYTPSALWCDVVQYHETLPVCFFMNEEGYAYAEAPSLVGETLMRFISEGVMPERGESPFRLDVFERYRLLSHELTTRYAEEIRTVVHSKDGDVTLYLSDDTVLLATQDMSGGEILSAVESVLAAKEFSKNSLKDFLSLDVRFKNKVYVRDRHTIPKPVPPPTVAAATDMGTGTTSPETSVLEAPGDTPSVVASSTVDSVSQ